MRSMTMLWLLVAILFSYVPSSFSQVSFSSSPSPSPSSSSSSSSSSSPSSSPSPSSSTSASTSASGSGSAPPPPLLEIYVSPTMGNDTFPGTIDAPKQTLKGAVGFIPHGGEMILMPGIFTGELNRIVPVALRLGFTIRSLTGDPDESVIDCESLGPAFFITEIPGLKPIDSDTGDIHISGITILRGASTEDGGGISITRAFVTLDNVKFLGCGTIKSGGAISCGYKCILFLNKCFFSNNKAGSLGGALYVQSGQALVKNSGFTNSSAADDGGGAACYSSTCIVKDSYFMHSLVGKGGSGFFAIGSFWKVDNVDFIKNNATDLGGGFLSQSSIGEVSSCTFSENRATVGSAIYLDAETTITNCLMEKNIASLAGCLYVGNALSPVIIDNNILIDNTGSTDGAIFITGGEGTEITNNVISRNRASQDTTDPGSSGVTVTFSKNIKSRNNTMEQNFGFRGTYYIFSSDDVFLEDDYFFDNEALFGGAILVNNSQNVRVKNSVFKKNKATMSGGGFFSIDADILFEDTVLESNKAETGGGAYITHTVGTTDKKQDVFFKNTEFLDNFASYSGGVMFFHPPTTKLSKKPDIKTKGNKAGYGDLFATAPTTLEITGLKSHIINQQTQRLRAEVKDSRGNRVNNFDVNLLITAEPDNVVLADFQPLTFSKGFLEFNLVIVGDLKANVTLTYVGQSVLTQTTFDTVVQSTKIENCDWDEEYFEYWPPNTELFRVCEDVEFVDSTDAETAIRTSFWVIVSILIVINILIMIGVVIWRKRPVFFYSSPFFMEVTMLGCLIVYIGACFFIAEASDVVCAMRPWLISIGFAMSMSALLSRTYRVWRLFDNPHFKVVKITDHHLAPVVIISLIIPIIICTLFTILARPRQDYLPDDKDDDTRYKQCTSPQPAGLIFIIILLAYAGIFLVVGIFFSFKTRSVSEAFNESKFIAFSVYCVAVLAVVVVPMAFFQGEDNPEGTLILMAGGIMLANTLVLYSLVLPKYLVLWKKTDMSNSIARTSRNMRKSTQM